MTILQSLAILMLLKYSDKIDYSVNKYYSKKKQKSIDDFKNLKLKKSRETTKALIYSLSTLFILFLEITVLILPKLPPKIDDIFSENRTLKYTYVQSEQGYYVTDVYSGLNNSIIIPLSFNNKPIVGISSGAITDDGILSNLQIGEYNSDGILVSNVKSLEYNSISLDYLTIIDLPNSIQEMASNAISG